MSSDGVLIVGGGLAGLSLAIPLGRRGVEAVVVERGSQGASAGAGLYLVGAATRALSALGLGPAAVQDGVESPTQTFFTHRAAACSRRSMQPRFGPAVVRASDHACRASPTPVRRVG